MDRRVRAIKLNLLDTPDFGTRCEWRRTTSATCKRPSLPQGKSVHLRVDDAVEAATCELKALESVAVLAAEYVQQRLLWEHLTAGLKATEWASHKWRGKSENLHRY